ncbi:MAG: hypothetical protein NVS3B17_05460 [Vulcanimicrobiaceae bacterium]
MRHAAPFVTLASIALVVPLAIAAPHPALAAVTDPCALLSAADASAALGGPVGKPQFVKGSDNVECDYKAPTVTATVMTSDREIFCTTMSKNTKVKMYPTIAPKAAYVYNVGSMFVPKHGTCAVIGLDSSKDLSATTQSVPASIVTIATKVASKL